MAFSCPSLVLPSVSELTFSSSLSPGVHDSALTYSRLSAQLLFSTVSVVWFLSTYLIKIQILVLSEGRGYEVFCVVVCCMCGVLAPVSWDSLLSLKS